MRQFRTTTTTPTTTTTETTPAKRKRKPCRFHGADHYLSRAEFEAVLACEPSPLYRTLWRLCLSHALRISEALSLRADNIQGNPPLLCVQRLKGSEYTRQPLLVDLSEQVNNRTYRLFPISRSSAFLHFRKAAELAGIDRDRRHPHVLRHSMACWLLQGGVDLAKTSRYLGHASISSTAAYLHASDASASAAAASVIGVI